ncbi:MAG: hypothetical protein H0T42_06715 [Deltaproteobacteria bacterium]|nr:hypothetical protein [Deltaproteobacteria bacterium]
MSAVVRDVTACLAAIVLAGCSRSTSSETSGRVVVALTIDWEGADVSPGALAAIEQVRRGLGDVPLTHFMSSAYFTKESVDPTLVTFIRSAVHKGDELAMHLHAWRSLAEASDVEPKVSPSFLTGTDEVLAFDHGDDGFDTDLDAYTVAELRLFLRTSRRLLEKTQLPISHTFRAGGYLGTPKVVQAIRDEGYTVDSSAIDHRQLDELEDQTLPARIRDIWPGVSPASQPWLIPAHGGQILEMPIAAFVDYSPAAEIAGVIEAAHARWKSEPGKDVFVVLGFHLETAEDHVGQLGEALANVRARPEIAESLMFTTIEDAAAQARSNLAAAPE